MKQTNGIVIYEALEEIIHKKHTCLVVWDVQNGLVDRIFNKDVFLSNLKTLIENLREVVPVFYTLITPPPKKFMSSWQYYSMMKRFGMSDPEKLPDFMAKGSLDRQIPQIVQPKDSDIVIEKSSASIFLGTYFENMLRSQNITSIIFTGIATEIGIESSVRDASNRGFYPIVVEDCVSSSKKEAHERSLLNLKDLVIIEKSFNIIKAISKA